MLDILAEYLDIFAELWYILDDTKNTCHTYHIALHEKCHFIGA